MVRGNYVNGPADHPVPQSVRCRTRPDWRGTFGDCPKFLNVIACEKDVVGTGFNADLRGTTSRGRDVNAVPATHVHDV